MEEFTQFIVAHGYLLLAGWVFLDQLGVPIPAVPVLIAAGALVGGFDGWLERGYSVEPLDT